MLPPTPSRSRSAGARGADPPAWVVWLLGPLVLLGSIVAAFAILHAPPLLLVGGVIGVVLVLAILWVLVSTLWPPHADRTCPRCGAEALERLDPATTVGVRCTACGFRDRQRSAWLLAEAEDRPEEAASGDTMVPARPGGAGGGRPRPRPAREVDGGAPAGYEDRNALPAGRADASRGSSGSEAS